LNAEDYFLCRGLQSPILIEVTNMISRETITELVKKHLEGTDLFIVEVHVSASDNIRILIDNPKGVTLEECIELNRAMEESLDRDKQDFQLEVSSPGLSEPLKVLPQYRKNIGRKVEILTNEGIKHEGKLTGLTQRGLVIEELVKIKGERKRPEIKAIEKEFDFDQILSTKVLIS
jgi:ribosome maturation factor RimP